tara:strand:- start:267 stop:761 length:495 start_codon:yes stop_codon:yes gene_type:complete
MIEDVLYDLRETKAFLGNLSNRQYGQRIELLSGSSIGMHLRHIIEFYQATLLNASQICYDTRQRNLQLEQDLQFSIQTLDSMIDTIAASQNDRSIALTINITRGNTPLTLNSSFYRELFYCVEHSIHHKAIIKIGVIAMGLEGTVLPEFGVAPATIQFHAAQHA